MPRFSRVLLGSAAAVALVSGAIAFSTSQASAQIPFIGGLPGFVPNGGFGSHHSRHGRGDHEARHDRRSKEKDAKDDDSGKGDDSGSKPDRVQLSGHGPDHGPETAASNPPSSSAPPPAPPPSPPSSGQPSGDVPSFTPEK
jgi:hypothetical protein